MTFELSTDGMNFPFLGTATGPVRATISFTNPPSSPVMVFDTEMQQLDLSGAIAGLGPFAVRESPSRPSLGKHTLRNDPPGFRVSSFFDVFLELNAGTGDWIPANRAVRLLADAPPAGPGSIFISLKGNEITLQWVGTLPAPEHNKSAGGWTDVAGAMHAPYTIPITASERQRFFRLRGE